MNYDSYLARAIEIFNDKMDADFSRDNVILTCFMTDEQEEIFEQFCAQYFPYRLKDRYQEEGYFDFRASSFIGMDNGGKDGILLRTDIPYHPVELLHIFLHELAHIYCVHHELDGKSFYDEYCEGYAHSNAEDGMINAGYAVWRECIAEIIAIECDDNCDIYPIRDKKKKLMTKKDGSLMANLINPETKKIVSTVSLGKVKLSPELSQAMTNYATQMQMAQIAEQIQFVQVAVEEVRQGQEYDRLATAYSCQQKLIQAAAIQNPRLKEMALMQLVSDAENSRNLLMQSQSANAAFIKNQPESTWGKILSGATPEKINARMNELRESLCAVNMVSLAEAIAYQEMGETEAAKVSLEYYAKFIQRTYLETKGFVERLDMIDPSPENYWTQKLPEIENRILALPSDNPALRLEEQKDEPETL